MPRKPTGRTKALLTVRVTPEELEALHRRARDAGFKTTSEWARRQLLGDALVDYLEATAEARQRKREAFERLEDDSASGPPAEEIWVDEAASDRALDRLAGRAPRALGVMADEIDLNPEEEVVPGEAWTQLKRKGSERREG